MDTFACSWPGYLGTAFVWRSDLWSYSVIQTWDLVD